MKKYARSWRHVAASVLLTGSVGVVGVATQMGAHAAPYSSGCPQTYSWVYFRVADGSTIADAEAGIADAEAALGYPPTTDTQSFVPLDLQNGLLACVPGGLASRITYAQPDKNDPTRVGVIPPSGSFPGVTGTNCATPAQAQFTFHSGVVLDDRFNAFWNSYNPTTDMSSANVAAIAMGAPSLWNILPQSGGPQLGDGIDVALIDTGVNPITGPAGFASYIVNGPDFSFDSQLGELTHLDGFGHGTQMAGIIHAVAPHARIVNIKVGDGTGAVDVTQVIAAVDWVREHAHSNGMNIKVINLSYGLNSQSGSSWQTDDLSMTVDRAWQDGIIVTAAAGNDDGSGAGLSNPATNKDVLAVGGYDSYYGGIGSSIVNGPAPFASTQTRTITRYPDVGAPAVSITAPRSGNTQADNAIGEELCEVASWSSGVPGSGTPIFYPYPITHDANGQTYVRGSGTSEATAMASGAAALLAGQVMRYSPSGMPSTKVWTDSTYPDVVKAWLQTTATSANAGKSYVGNGKIDLAAAMARSSIPWGSSQSHTAVVSSSPIETTRGGDAHMFDELSPQSAVNMSKCAWGGSTPTQPDVSAGAPLCGEKDFLGDPYSVTTHSVLAFSASPKPAGSTFSADFAGEWWNGADLVAPAAQDGPYLPVKDANGNNAMIGGFTVLEPPNDTNIIDERLVASPPGAASFSGQNGYVNIISPNGPLVSTSVWPSIPWANSSGAGGMVGMSTLPTPSQTEVPYDVVPNSSSGHASLVVPRGDTRQGGYRMIQAGTNCTDPSAACIAPDAVITAQYGLIKIHNASEGTTFYITASTMPFNWSGGFISFGKSSTGETNTMAIGHWDGSRWVGSRWLGSRWVGSRWVGSRWVGSRWVGSRWVGSRWVTASF